MFAQGDLKKHQIIIISDFCFVITQVVTLLEFVISYSITILKLLCQRYN